MEKISTPSLYHLILGGGFEVSLQVKVMLPPMVIVVMFWDTGVSPDGSIRGGNMDQVSIKRRTRRSAQ